MADVFFLTGATGFLGTMLAAGLIRIPEASTYVLVRAADDEEAYHRLRGLWYHDRDLYESIGKKIFPVVGDFNCVGTKNMLALAGQMKSLKRFVYISTAYVAGQKSGIVMETDKPGEEFSSLYEKSKAEAEELVRSSELAYTIIRPGMIVGDSKTGWIRNFNTIYYVLKLMLLGRLPILPIDKANMDRAVAQSREILERIGVPKEKQFLGTLNAGHPGGMLPLTAAESETLHSPLLPENLYVADATILPKAMGNPPILTIMALAKKIAELV